MTRFSRLILLLILTGFSFSGAVYAESNEVPVIDAGLGPCTADVQVMDSGHHPIYKADVSTTIRYGFAGVKRLDLDVGTNVEGKARFIGIPEKTRDMLQFTANFQGRQNTVIMSPEENCHQSLSIFLPDRPVTEQK
ncbi:MAG TPA: hypothetical protein VKW78_10915 [Terriglobales bacterium]|nr:hypothetical protein [Terriglobales bacterium]